MTRLTWGELPWSTGAKIPLPANFIAAKAAMRELDRLSKALCAMPIPQDQREREAEAVMWAALAKGMNDVIKATYTVQGRAIREGNTLWREIGPKFSPTDQRGNDR